MLSPKLHREALVAADDPESARYDKEMLLPQEGGSCRVPANPTRSMELTLVGVVLPSISPLGGSSLRVGLHGLNDSFHSQGSRAFDEHNVAGKDRLSQMG